MSKSVGPVSTEALRTDGLARVARALAELEDQERSLGQVCEEVRRVLGTSAAAINLLEQSGDSFSWAAHRGVPELVQSHGAISRELFEGFAARFDPVFSETRMEALRDEPNLALFVENGMQAIASATVRHEGRVLGLVSAASYHVSREPFSVPELTWLQTVGDIVVQAVLRQRSLLDAQESESRYRRIVSTMRDGVWAVSAEQLTEFVNPQMARMLGYEVHEMLGRSLFDFMDPQWAELGRVRWNDRRQGLAERHEFLLRRKDGSELWAIISATPLWDAAGHFAGALAVVADVTEQRRLELKLQHAQKLESLGVLAGGIAHDFNNLLVGVLGNASIAIEDLPSGSPLAPVLHDIQAAAERAADLTRQMLAYSGRGRFLVQWVNLNEVVRETLQLLQSSISGKAELNVHLARELPAIRGDATQIRQVVMNLVSNASDAVDERGGEITLSTGRLRADREYLANTYWDDDLPEGNYAFVEISDSGCGMTRQTLDKMFDPFFTTKFTGRGLGLAAVLGILRGHRGAVKVSSTVGQGTSFRVLLPAMVEAHALETPALPSEAPCSGYGLVLVADDEESVRMAAKRVLERAGYRVATAADGRQALDVFTRCPEDYAAVLLDMTMPHLSGEHTFLELRRIWPPVRVVLTSGYDEQEATEGLAGVGHFEFLHKPWLPNDLLRAIERAMQQPLVPSDLPVAERRVGLEIRE